MKQAIAPETGVLWLVEDNKLHAKMVAQAFDRTMTLRVFDNGASVLEHISTGAPLCDVVVLDSNLPDMSGLQVCRFLREAHDEISLPILMLTTQGQKSDIVDGFNAGANDYLTKPFDATELRARVDTWLRVKRLSEERARAETERERYRELMLAMIGHDLRTPLSAISLGADAMAMLDGSTDAHQRVLTRIKSSSGRMSRMIEQLLDFTRSRFGGIELKRARVELAPILEQCAEEFELAAPASVLQIESKADCRGQWDSDRLSQVIGNLLSNANSHGAKGAAIQLFSGCNAEYAEIEVRNQGVPIPEALLGAIFDPFRRGDHNAPRAKGLGLGLYIARQIVEAHGGEINVESSSDHTSFKIKLPLGSTTEI